MNRTKKTMKVLYVRAKRSKQRATGMSQTPHSITLLHCGGGVGVPVDNGISRRAEPCTGIKIQKRIQCSEIIKQEVLLIRRRTTPLLLPAAAGNNINSYIFYTPYLRLYTNDTRTIIHQLVVQQGHTPSPLRGFCHPPCRIAVQRDVESKRDSKWYTKYAFVTSFFLLQEANNSSVCLRSACVPAVVTDVMYMLRRQKKRQHTTACSWQTMYSCQKTVFFYVQYFVTWNHTLLQNHGNITRLIAAGERAAVPAKKRSNKKKRLQGARGVPNHK